MTNIGLLSDTHGYWDEKYLHYFSNCQEIWHAGDIGSLQLAQQLAQTKTLRAVYGNIDGQDIRSIYPQYNYFTVENVRVLMTHIGGYPGHYYPSIKGQLDSLKPNLFVAGHSHILKIMYDQKLQCLHLNPGAAGKSGFHKVRSLLRFVIDKDDIKDMEIIELSDSDSTENA